MKHWIIALPRADMDHCIEIGKFGRSQRHTAKVAKGDRIACYVTGDRKIIALGTVTQGYYFEETPIFRAEGIYPQRFDFAATAVEPEADLISVIDRLSFITNIAYWSVYFRLGLKEISVDDWSLIQRLCNGLIDSRK